MTVSDFSDVTTNVPQKRLTKGKQRTSGRNGAGRITIRHRGGGHKRRLRDIDFRRFQKAGIPAVVASIEYDPNRTARIALLTYRDGEKRYILAPDGLKVGDEVVCGERTKVKVGNCMHMSNIPVGYKVHCVELQRGLGARMVRSAGGSATIAGADAPYVILQLPSGEMRRVRGECFATIGTVSNPDHSLVTIGKAGRIRWMGRRPQVLGKSMNAVDHPHGGGEGHSTIGLKAPKTPWGKKALGVKTRRKKKDSSMIVRSRRQKNSKV